MKRKKYSKKVHKNKIFRKKAYKTYKSSRSPSHRLHRGGAIDWGRAQSKTPGSPKQKLPSPPPLTESLKRLLSEKGEGEGIKRDSSPIKYLHKSEKTPSQIQSKKNTPKKDLLKKEPELYTPISSISHEQLQQTPIRPPPLPMPLPMVDPTEIVQSYQLSASDIPNPTDYNPPKNTFITTPNLIPMEIPHSYPPSMMNLQEYKIRTQPEPSPPQPLVVKTGSPNVDLTASETQMIRSINVFNEGYYTLAPTLYSIMRKNNLSMFFGTALVWGDLNDRLIECIGVSSEKAIESRLLYTNRPHIKLFIEQCNLFYTNLGPSVSGPHRDRPREYDLVTAPTPLHQADPYSYRVVGYNRHPFFHPPPITEAMYEEGMKNIHKKDNEYIFVQAHGGMGEELSPHKKILAKKYIRLIEFGSALEMVTAHYRPFYKKINDLMRQPDYHILFESTTRGKQMRQSVYSTLCKYFKIGSIEACSTKDSLTLVDITQERLFEGHFPDNEIVDNHKVTFRSMEKFTSMGIFVPVDYNHDISDKLLYKKEMFKLYPDSNFFTKSTQVKLVDTLLPIAIQKNKIFNVIVFSCAVRQPDEPPSPPPLPPPILGVPQPPIQPPPVLPGMPPNPGRTLQRKSGDIQRHMFALLKGKRYISDLLKFVTQLEIDSTNASVYVGVKDLYDSNGAEMRTAAQMSELDKDNMVLFLEKIRKVHTIKQSFFSDYSLPIISRLFSFNDANFSHKGSPYYLIDSQENPNINDQSNYDFIMVKIYLMKEFYDKCYKKVLFIRRVIHKIYSVLIYLRRHIVSNPRYTQVYDDNFPILKLLDDYTAAVVNILDFCNKGLQKTGPASFYNYPKFVEMVEEYKKKRMAKMYDDIFPKMNFDQYNFALKELPSGWEAIVHDASNRMYYVNTNTGQSYWNRPLIPPGWTEHIDDATGKPYYIRDETNDRSDVLPGIHTNYPDYMYFSDKTEAINQVPAPGFRKQRQYMYKYDERDNIDKVKARFTAHKRKTDVKAHLLSSARKREQTVKNRKARDYESKADLKKNPLIKDRFMEKAAEIREEIRNEKYHVSV